MNEKYCIHCVNWDAVNCSCYKLQDFGMIKLNEFGKGGWYFFVSKSDTNLCKKIYKYNAKYEKDGAEVVIEHKAADGVSACKYFEDPTPLKLLTNRINYGKTKKA